eukprot:12473975-Alexandrium_andersonii.AAC.1
MPPSNTALADIASTRNTMGGPPSRCALRVKAFADTTHTCTTTGVASQWCLRSDIHFADTTGLAAPQR